MNFFVKAINKIRATVQRGTTNARTLIDISKWQSSRDDSKLFDFDVYETSDGIMIITKASQGIYADRRFAYYISEIIPRKIFFGTYHFADMDYTAKASAAYWAAQINALPDDEYRKATEITRHWLDVENAGFDGRTKVQGRTWVREFLVEMEVLCPGVRIGIYTSYYAWTDNIAWMPEVADRDLWIAHYGNVPAPSIPQEWYLAGKTWTLWQTCDSCTRCGGCGKKYGAASASIDINEFNGDITAFIAWKTRDGEDEEMSSQEYLELKERCDELEATLLVLRDDFDTHSHNGGDPPGSEYDTEYTVTASPSLTLRETPETGAKVVSMPYNATVSVDTSTKIPDSQGRGYWVPTKYGVYEGWAADWYLKKKF